jgi:hypothetical protein
LTPHTLEQIATVVGAVLTLMVFSYLLGDNFLYRIAIHIFIGATAGFVLIVAFESVLIPWINITLLSAPLEMPRLAVGLIPFMIGILLLFKGSPRFSRLGDLGLMIVLGVGTALALWGAISGTLLPLITSTVREFRPANVINGLIVLIGTISVLVYFTYTGLRRSGGEVSQLLPVRFTGLIGQAFIVITLGATYALLIISALTVLTGVIAQRLLILRPGG